MQKFMMHKSIRAYLVAVHFPIIFCLSLEKIDKSQLILSDHSNDIDKHWNLSQTDLQTPMQDRNMDQSSVKQEASPLTKSETKSPNTKEQQQQQRPRQTQSINSQVNTIKAMPKQTQNRSIPSNGVKLLSYQTGDTILLKCRIARGPYLVLWNKVGLDYPLTIGTSRFIPDDRVQIHFKPPNRWNLLIRNARLNDSGVYTCTTGAEANLINKHGAKRLNSYSEQKLTKTKSDKQYKSKRRRKKHEYYVSVVKPIQSDRYLVDEPVKTTTQKHKSITVTGPKLVFYGTPLELICRATFPSLEAKLDPTITLEWYHRGIRRYANPKRSGGVYITTRWLDSYLLESKLFVAWASADEAGQWICVEYSTVNKKDTRLSAIHGHELAENEPHLLNPRYPSLSSSMEFIYDKINVEIIIPNFITTNIWQMDQSVKGRLDRRNPLGLARYQQNARAFIGSPLRHWGSAQRKSGANIYAFLFCILLNQYHIAEYN